MAGAKGPRRAGSARPPPPRGALALLPGLGMIRRPLPAPRDRKPAFGISPSKAGKARAHGHRARAAQPRRRGLRPKDNPARLCATLAVRVGPCVNKV